MNSTLRHRGPDDQGMLLAPGVGLAVRRLSIVDVAGGHQPISNETEDCWIVFNGEIYNYQSLAQELRRGHRFRTQTDTEVVLHLYEEYGSQCVERLDGMFAFAIYDCRPTTDNDEAHKHGRLFIARDRLGKKPLYYADVDGCLVFASELKALRVHPRISSELDPEAISHYVSLLMVPAPWSIYKSVRKLVPGHFLTADTAGCRVAHYWDFREHVREEVMPEQAAVQEVRRLLGAAVQKRLMGEVPLGAFLSGGLDSGAVVAMMTRCATKKVKTYSVGFEGPEHFNELPYARAVARHCGTDHHEIVVKPDVIRLLSEVHCFADEPFAIASAIPLYLLAQTAKQEVTVVLTGDGGDEVFGGYRSYLYERWVAAYRRVPSTFDSLVRTSVRLLDGHQGSQGQAAWGCRVSRFLANARVGLSERCLDLRSGIADAEKSDLLRLEGRPVEVPWPLTTAMLERYVPTSPSLSTEVHRNIQDILLFLPDEMLVKVDRMTMAHSMEARCPLLDTTLVEYAAGLSFRMKLAGWRDRGAKRLLKKAVEGMLPAELVKRRKHTFDVPLAHWFQQEARGYVDSVLQPERIRRQGLFNPKAVTERWRRYLAGNTSATSGLYAIIVLQLWSEMNR